MTTGNTGTGTTGVQELIDRIRGQGVEAAKREGERIVTEARREAAAVKARAEAEAKSLVEGARAQAEAEKAAGIEAIRNAARDSLLELRNQTREAFEAHVRRLVSMELQNTGFVRSLVLVLAGEAAEKYIDDKDAVLLVSSALADSQGVPPEGAVREKIKNAVLGAAGQMLREGIELTAADGIKSGVRVRLKGEKLEIDMTEEGLSRLLLKNLLPRYRAIVEE